MVSFIIYLVIFIAINIALILNWILDKSKKINCRKINIEKCLEITKNFAFILFPAMMVQMLAYYDTINQDESNIVTVIFVCLAAAYLLEMIWYGYKYRNMSAIRCAYNCDINEIDKIGGVIRKKGYLLAPKNCVDEIIGQINEQPKESIIKNKRLVGYIISVVVSILFLIVGITFEGIIEFFAEINVG